MDHISPPLLTLREQIVAVAEAFANSKNHKSLKRLSTVLFNDSARLDKLKAEGDVTTQTFERAMLWMSENWPDGAVWPADVPRPTSMIAAAE